MDSDGLKMGWPDVKHCSICHESFSEGGFDISHIWNLGIDHAYACSSKCEIESQSLDFPNAWDSKKHNKIHEEQHTE